MVQEVLLPISLVDQQYQVTRGNLPNLTEPSKDRSTEAAMLARSKFTEFKNQAGSVVDALNQFVSGVATDYQLAIEKLSKVEDAATEIAGASSSRVKLASIAPDSGMQLRRAIADRIKVRGGDKLRAEICDKASVLAEGARILTEAIRHCELFKSRSSSPEQSSIWAVAGKVILNLQQLVEADGDPTERKIAFRAFASLRTELIKLKESKNLSTFPIAIRRALASAIGLEQVSAIDAAIAESQLTRTDRLSEYRVFFNLVEIVTHELTKAVGSKFDRFLLIDPENSAPFLNGEDLLSRVKAELNQICICIAPIEATEKLTGLKSALGLSREQVACLEELLEIGYLNLAVRQELLERDLGVSDESTRRQMLTEQEYATQLELSSILRALNISRELASGLVSSSPAFYFRDIEELRSDLTWMAAYLGKDGDQRKLSGIDLLCPLRNPAGFSSRAAITRSKKIIAIAMGDPNEACKLELAQIQKAIVRNLAALFRGEEREYEVHAAILISGFRPIVGNGANKSQTPKELQQKLRAIDPIGECSSSFDLPKINKAIIALNNLGFVIKSNREDSTSPKAKWHIVNSSAKYRPPQKFSKSSDELISLINSVLALHGRFPIVAEVDRKNGKKAKTPSRGTKKVVSDAKVVEKVVVDPVKRKEREHTLELSIRRAVRLVAGERLSLLPHLQVSSAGTTSILSRLRMEIGRIESVASEVERIAQDLATIGRELEELSEKPLTFWDELVDRLSADSDSENSATSAKDSITPTHKIALLLGRNNSFVNRERRVYQEGEELSPADRKHVEMVLGHINRAKKKVIDSDPYKKAKDLAHKIRNRYSEITRDIEPFVGLKSKFSLFVDQVCARLENREGSSLSDWSALVHSEREVWMERVVELRDELASTLKLSILLSKINYENLTGGLGAANLINALVENYSSDQINEMINAMQKGRLISEKTAIEYRGLISQIYTSAPASVEEGK